MDSDSSGRRKSRKRKKKEKKHKKKKKCHKLSEAALRKRNEAYARSIAILHALQGSLDFENGGEIADNLFLVYEFARLQLLESFRSCEADRIDVAITSLQEIAGAWDQMDTPLANSTV
ncbi:MAG: flagellar protein FliS [Candidatus Puniceispirillaceae bacterium]